jgi:hypothetical protein
MLVGLLTNNILVGYRSFHASPKALYILANAAKRCTSF